MAGTIYFATYPMPLPTAGFQALLEQLPAYMQRKITQLRRWEDAHASLLGKHLLLKALKSPWQRRYIAAATLLRLWTAFS